LTQPDEHLEVEMDDYTQVPTAIIEASSTLINSSTKGTVSSPTQGSTETFVRLRRRTSPVEGGTQVHSPSPPPAPRPRNAFDALRAGARQAGAHGAHGPNDTDKRKRPGFLDEQAEESDEDNAWGFTGGKDDDENDDDLDNGYVPDLLDDANVTEEERTRLTELNAERFRYVVERRVGLLAFADMPIGRSNKRMMRGARQRPRKSRKVTTVQSGAATISCPTRRMRATERFV
jgi:hypothetical protein